MPAKIVIQAKTLEKLFLKFPKQRHNSTGQLSRFNPCAAHVNQQGQQ